MLFCNWHRSALIVLLLSLAPETPALAIQSPADDFARPNKASSSA
jgi:hypothetical protein